MANGLGNFIEANGKVYAGQWKDDKRCARRLPLHRTPPLILTTPPPPPNDEDERYECYQANRDERQTWDMHSRRAFSQGLSYTAERGWVGFPQNGPPAPLNKEGHLFRHRVGLGRTSRVDSKRVEVL